MPTKIARYGSSAPSGEAGFTDAFNIQLKVTDTNALPTDAGTFAIAYSETDTNAGQTEAVQLGFPQGVFGDSSTTPTDGSNFGLKVWLSGSAGANVTSPSNADGQNDGAVATLRSSVPNNNPIVMTSQLGTNVPNVTLTNATYRGWFRSVSPLTTGSTKITLKSTGGLFSDIVMFENSGLGVTVDHLSGTFTFDMYAAGVNTLAKLQSVTVEHRTQDLAAGVSPHVLTVDSACVEVGGAFI